jgi:hypothetical protein
MKYKNLIFELLIAIVVVGVLIMLYNSVRPNESVTIGSQYLYYSDGKIDTVKVIKLDAKTVSICNKNDTMEVLRKMFLSNSERISKQKP